MEVTVHLDGDTTKREEGFFETKINTLQKTIKALEFDNAELVVANNTLAERCTKLASQQPIWPKGYRPRRNTSRKDLPERPFPKRDSQEIRRSLASHARDETK